LRRRESVRQEPRPSSAWEEPVEAELRPPRRRKPRLSLARRAARRHGRSPLAAEMSLAAPVLDDAAAAVLGGGGGAAAALRDGGAAVAAVQG